MTRKQVARKLGKSIATVRALEGVHLHPVEDERGVWQFDPEEVERVASDIQSGLVNLWQAGGEGNVVQSPTLECPQCREWRTLVGQLEVALERTKLENREKLESLEDLHRSARARQDRQFEREVIEFVAVVDQLLR